MTREYRIRLEGQRSAPGELLANDAVALISAFKDLTYRLTRMVTDRVGLGRTDAPLEALAQVRVGQRISHGATELTFQVGDDTALELDDPVSTATDEAFAAVVDGIRTNQRPTALAESAATAAGALAAALVRSAIRVTITVPSHSAISITTRTIRAETWQRAPRITQATVHGTLEMVDLHNAHFRLREAGGVAVELIDVIDPVTASHLVGGTVTATGMLSTAESQRPRMERPQLARGAALEISA